MKYIVRGAIVLLTCLLFSIEGRTKSMLPVEQASGVNLVSLESLNDLIEYSWLQDTVINRTDEYVGTDRLGRTVIYGIHDYVPNWLPNNPKSGTSLRVSNYGPACGVQYQMSPTNSDVTYEDVAGFNVLSYQANLLNISSPKDDYAGQEIFKTSNGIVTVGLKIQNPQFLNSSPTSMTNEDEYGEIALKINFKTTDGNRAEIVSNYTRLKGTKYWLEALIWAKKPQYAAGISKNRAGDELGIFGYGQYGMGTTTASHASSKVHVWDSPEEALSDPDGAALELYYYDEEGITLSNYLGIHAVHNDSKTGSHIVSTLKFGSEKAYGLSYEFNLIDYGVEGSDTRNSKYADWGKIGATAEEKAVAKAKGQLVARNYLDDGVTIDTESASAVDREPLVQVLVKNNQGEVMLDGYILVHIASKEKQTLKLTELPTMACGDEPYVLPSTTEEGQTLIWTSSNTDIATVSGTQLIAKKAGTVTITARQEGNEDYRPFVREFILTVVEKPQEIVVTDISQLGNAIYIEPFSACIGGNVNIEIHLKNAQAASAYNFDLVLPEGVTVAKDGNGRYIDALSDRHDDHTRTFNYKGDNVYSFATLSGNSEALTGNDGAIRLVTLHVANEVAEGTYPIEIKNASYSLTDGKLQPMANTTTAVTVENYILGDVNGNNMVDIGDAVSIVNYLVGKPSATFIEKAADTNKNNQVDIGDAVTIVNFLVGKTANLSRSTRTAMDEKEPQ